MMPKLHSLQELTRLREDIKTRDRQVRNTGTVISIGMGTCGIAAGARETATAIEQELQKRHIEVRVRTVGCIGLCAREPLVEIQQAGGSRILYANVQPDMVGQLIENHLLRGLPVREWIVCRLEES
jgi:(2Fe-2S) ferredoxin